MSGAGAAGASADAVVDKARDYYDSDDADRFYATIWGGEDIHIGIYLRDDEPIADASRRTVREMCEVLGDLTSTARVLDIGSGYGGSARYLARRFGCRVTCLNLSRVQNARNRDLTARAGLAGLVSVTPGNFEELPFDDGSFDAVWSQDAILHSARRARVFAEVARVLRPDGRFVFTDPMQRDDVPPGALQPVYERIHLSSLGSPGTYARVADEVGLGERCAIDLSAQLSRHYARVHEELTARRDELTRVVSTAYVERMLVGLQHWVEAGERDLLCWGIQRFTRARA